MARKKKIFFNKKKITSVPWGIESKTSVSVSNHLTTSAKFTFEILGLKHIYKLFTVRELQWKRWCRIKTYQFQNFAYHNTCKIKRPPWLWTEDTEICHKLTTPEIGKQRSRFVSSRRHSKWRVNELRWKRRCRIETYQFQNFAFVLIHIEDIHITNPGSG